MYMYHFITKWKHSDKRIRYRCVYSHLFCCEASPRRYAWKKLCITSRLHFNLKMIHTIRWWNEWNLNGCSKMSFCTEEYRRGTKQMAWYMFCSCFFSLFIFCGVYECSELVHSHQCHFSAYTYTHVRITGERDRKSVWLATFLIRGAIQHFKITDLCRCARE